MKMNRTIFQKFIAIKIHLSVKKFSTSYKEYLPYSILKFKIYHKLIDKILLNMPTILFLKIL